MANILIITHAHDRFRACDYILRRFVRHWLAAGHRVSVVKGVGDWPDADIAFLQPWLAHHFRGRAVLEVACGTGFWTPHVASEARHLIATDGTAEPLALARARPGCERVEFAPSFESQAVCQLMTIEVERYSASRAAPDFSR